MAQFRFVTIFGQGSDLSFWPTLKAELNRQKTFFSTNIDKIKFESIFKSPAEILENVRHPACVGVIVLLSDKYFSYLDAQAASEKEVLLDHIQNKRHIFSVLAAEAVTERPEFNIIRNWHLAQNPDALALDLRAWLQEPAASAGIPIEFHPEIHAILKVACGPNIEDFSGLISRKAEGINYNLYRYRDPIMGSRNFVAYLHPNTVITRTAEHLKSHFGHALESQPLLVIADPKNVTNRDTWLRTIRAQFDCTNCLFLDDFLQQKFSLTLSPTIPPARTVLPPRSRLAPDGEVIDDSFAYFTAFVERSMEDLPIVVIQGQGGIGKTTFSKHLQRLVANKGHTELIVLSAPDVIKEINENPEVAANFTLFNLLRSMFPTREMSALGEQEFAWIFDTGRLSIVIDGIDEIIPRLPSSASMHVLFASIVRYSNYLRRGKIFLTCRNNALLNDFASDAKLEEYDLLPFDTGQVSQYIEARFPGLRPLQQKTYQFLDEVQFTSDDGILPFVLRIACDSVQNSVDSENSDRSLETSDVLALNRKLDHVIYKVCEREEAKYEYSRFLGRNSVDAQCLFFIQLALTDHGQCTRIRMEQFFKAYNADIDKEIISRLAGHPLIEQQSNLLQFAYDVIIDFFLTLGFHRGITGAGALELTEVAHVANRCQINAPFLEEVADRIDKLTDEIILTTADYVASWFVDLSVEGALEEYYRCASALFNAGLQFLSRRHANDAGRMTDYLISVFKHPGDEGGLLRGAALHNIPENARVRFDFSDLVFDKASIVGFDDFMRCRFNANTRFRNSKIKPGSVKSRDTSATRDNFIDCDLEGTVHDSMNRMIEKRSYQAEDAKIQLRNFLRVFRLHSSFHHKRQIVTLKANFHSNTGLGFRDIQKICEEEGLVETSGNEVSIAREEIENVEVFITERIYQGRVQKCVKRILDVIK
jgi:hypothetical protein